MQQKTHDVNRQKALGAIGLAFQLAKSEFKLRNEGSYLGILWYLLNPILTFGILYLVFSNTLGNDIEHYPLYLMLGIIMFNMFQSTTTESAKAILREYHHLVKSIRFPRESLILSIVIKSIFSHIFEIALFGVLLAYFHISLIGIVLYIPILAIMSVLIYGISLMLSSLTVYFVDLDNIWSFASKILWFGTPIFYAMESQDLLYQANLFNPMYYLITIARDIVVYQQMPSPLMLWGAIGFSVGICAMGMALFARLKRHFAEMI